MPKGYWIAHVDVHDPERYKKYVAGATPSQRELGKRSKTCQHLGSKQANLGDIG